MPEYHDCTMAGTAAPIPRSAPRCRPRWPRRSAGWPPRRPGSAPRPRRGGAATSGRRRPRTRPRSARRRVARGLDRPLGGDPGREPLDQSRVVRPGEEVGQVGGGELTDVLALVDGGCSPRRPRRRPPPRPRPASAPGSVPSSGWTIRRRASAARRPSATVTTSGAHTSLDPPSPRLTAVASVPIRAIDRPRPDRSSGRSGGTVRPARCGAARPTWPRPPGPGPGGPGRPARPGPGRR